MDSDGFPRTSANFHGAYTILYFGFTKCPDICPSELGSMNIFMSLILEFFYIQLLRLELFVVKVGKILDELGMV